jgi:Tryptophan-associated transmembrane protein (Trp_oprn_chp)
VTPSRLRLISMAAIVVEVGLVSLAWSQTWYLLRLSGAEYPVGGDIAGGALLPLALASLTLVLALALAGPVFRVILGVLDALLGVCVVAVVAWSLSDTVRASLPVLTDATGFTAEEQEFFDKIAGTVITVWPYVGLFGGILMIATGLFIAVTSRAWPVSGRKYSRVRAETPGGDAVNDWDALSEGDDPTDSPR